MLQAMFVTFWIHHAIAKVEVPLDILYSLHFFNTVPYKTLNTVLLVLYMLLIIPSTMLLCLH